MDYIDNEHIDNKIECIDEVLKKKIFALLGFAKKSANLTSGMELVINNIKKQKLVLIAGDCSEGQTKKIVNACKNAKISYYIIFDADVLSRSVGEVNRVCVGIKDSQFAQSIENIIKQEQSEGGVYGKNSNF